MIYVLCYVPVSYLVIPMACSTNWVQVISRVSFTYVYTFRIYPCSQHIVTKGRDLCSYCKSEACIPFIQCLEEKTFQSKANSERKLSTALQKEFLINGYGTTPWKKKKRRIGSIRRVELDSKSVQAESTVVPPLWLS